MSQQIASTFSELEQIDAAGELEDAFKEADACNDLGRKARELHDRGRLRRRRHGDAGARPRHRGGARGGDELVVVSVAEMPFNPEGPQNFGTLGDTPARMIPLVEPEELEPVREQARAKIEAAGIAADYVWGAGEPASAIVGAANDRGRGWSCSALITTACSAGSWARTSPPW